MLSGYHQLSNGFWLKDDDGSGPYASLAEALILAGVTPADMFPNNDQGFWINPNDLTSLFTTNTGAIQVTTSGQTVGFLLDKRLRLLLGSELIANPGGPFVDTAGWIAGDFAGGSAPATLSVVNGRLRVTNNVNNDSGNAYRAIPTTIGKWYKIAFTFFQSLGTGNIRAGNTLNGENLQQSGITPTTLQGFFQATHASTLVAFANGTGAGYNEWGSISVKSIEGAHIRQPSSGPRPRIEARVNRFNYSEQFNQAGSWSVGGGSVSANADGIADKLLGNDVFTNHEISQSAVDITAGEAILSVEAKAAEVTAIYLAILTKANTFKGAYFNLLTGAVTNPDAGVVAPSPELLEDGYYRCKVTADVLSGGTTVQGYIVHALNGAPLLSGSVTNGVLIRKADIRTAADANLNIPEYQKTEASGSYDFTGFPRVLQFDGADDNLSGTGGVVNNYFFFCAAIRLLDGIGAERHIFSNESNNTGVVIKLSATQVLQFLAGNGSAFVTVETASAIPQIANAVICAWHDGVNINVQVDDGPIASAAIANISNGVDTFTLGKKHLVASNYFKGGIGNIVYRSGVLVTEEERLRIKRSIAKASLFI